MGELTCGVAVGLTISAFIVAVYLPKNINVKKQFGKTLKIMEYFVDELVENIHG